jgi:hypothetical protein
MTDFRALCAEQAENVRYLLDCVADGDSDPVAIAECVQHLGFTRAALARPEGEGEALRELQWPASVAQGCHEAAAEAESGSPLQQLLVAAGDLLERGRSTAPPAPKVDKTQPNQEDSNA